jgi:hypothetical protein
MLEIAPETIETPDVAPFEGDIAIKALRRELALHPGHLPEPPQPLQGPSLARFIGRALLVVVPAALIAFAAVFLLSPARELTSPAVGPKVADGTSGASAADAFAKAQPSDALPAQRLVGKDRQVPVNSPLSPGLSIAGPAAGAIVEISGLAEEARLAAATPMGQGSWRIAAPDLAQVLVHPPQDFVGGMDAIVDLRLADGSIADSRVLRFEWIAATAEPPAGSDGRPQSASAPPPAEEHPALSLAEIAVLVKRGHEFLTAGDIAAARVVLRRAAEGGSHHAAFALGMSYDPAALKQAGVLGIAPDVAEARRWYRKAALLGSAEASRRLAELPQTEK